MSRYSYRVEKLLRETKSPSLDILLEEEGDEAEETPSSDEPESGSEDNDEGIPDDAFSEDEPEDGESEESGEEGEEAPADDGKTDSKKLADIESFIKKSELAGANIRDRSHEKRFRGIANDFFKALDGISAKSSFSKTFESKSYSNQSIKNFIFEAEGDDDSQENIESSIESLESMLNSKENQLPDALDLAKISYQYFERFDLTDRAIYIIKLVSKYFKRFINPNKDKVFDEFIDRFLAILQENGIDIELDRSEAVKYKTAVGARTAG